LAALLSLIGCFKTTTFVKFGTILYSSRSICVRLCIVAYIRLGCTPSSSFKFVAGAHRLWRLTAAKLSLSTAIDLPPPLSLQASISLTSQLPQYIRFSQKYIRSLPQFNRSQTRLHVVTRPCRTSPCRNTTSCRHLNNTLNARRTFGPPRKHMKECSLGYIQL
jgi:hypothetical protein